MPLGEWPFAGNPYAGADPGPSLRFPAVTARTGYPSQRTAVRWRPLGDMEGHDTGGPMFKYDKRKQGTRAMQNQLRGIPEYRAPSRRPIRARALHTQLVTR